MDSLSIALVIPLLGAALGLFVGLGLSASGATLLAAPAASAGFIAAPAAVRAAPSEARPAIHLALPLGIASPSDRPARVPLHEATAGTLVG